MGNRSFFDFGICKSSRESSVCFSRRLRCGVVEGYETYISGA